MTLRAPKIAIGGLGIVIMACCGSAERQWTVLPAEHAESLLEQCSRSTPKTNNRAWDPGPADIEQLESHLKDLEAAGFRIEDVDDYCRQYIGIVVQGRDVIYVNAFPCAPRHSTWREAPVNFCDGGRSYWGAVFDPATGKFTRLAFNGAF